MWPPYYFKTVQCYSAKHILICDHFTYDEAYHCGMKLTYSTSLKFMQLPVGYFLAQIPSATSNCPISPYMVLYVNP